MKQKKFLFAFLILSSFVVYGQELSIQGQFLKNNLKVLPSQIVNIPFVVENTGNQVRKVSVEILVPKQWKVIIKHQSAELNPGENKLLLFSFQVSEYASVGSFLVKLQVTDAKNPSLLSSHEIVIDVLEKEDLAVMLVASDKYVKAGDKLEAVFRILNRGNVRKKIYLEPSNCILEGSREVEVDPGSAIDIKTFVGTNSEILKTNRSYLSLKATSGNKVYGGAYHAYTIYPQKGVKRDLYFRFPVTVSGGYLFSNQNDVPMSGYQFEVEGNGTLDASGEHYLEFLARGPDNNRFSYMGLYDQYYLRYKNPMLETTLGERTYQFTPLTESSRYGLGAEAKMQLNNGFRLGGTYVKPRFIEDVDYEYAGYFGYEFNRYNYFDVYYVGKQMTLSPEVIHLTSLNAKLNPFKRTYLDVEFSRGFYKGEADIAYRLNLNTRFSIFRLVGNYYNTGENYPGYYNNSSFYSANLSARLSKKVDVSFYAKEDFQNAQLDTFFITAPYTKAIQTSLNWKMSRNKLWRFYWRDYEQKDRLSKDKFHYKTRSLNAQYNHKYKFLDYNILGEYGNTTNLKDDVVDNQQKTYRVSFNAGFQISRKHHVQLFGNWSNVNSFISNDQRTFTYGGSARSQIAKNIQASLYLQNYYNVDQYYQNRNLMRCNLEYRFKNRHKISASSYYTLFRSETENPTFTFSLSYSCKIGVPLKQVEEFGELKGYISDKNGEPIEGVVLSILSEKAVSDENGEFNFSALAPGRNLLHIDKSKMNVEDVVSIPFPVELDIISGQESTLNLSVEPGAILKGRFVTNKTENVHGTIVVELQSEFENMRISTKNDGSFSFPVVRPGSYLLKVYGGTIPSSYVLKKEMYDIELHSGEKHELNIVLEQKQRKIIFKSQNFILTPVTKTVKYSEDENEKLAVQGGQQELFYSVQIGAFRNKRSGDEEYFRGSRFDFEMDNGNLYRYFIGKYLTKDEAQNKKNELQTFYKDSIVVSIKGEKVEPVN